MTNFILKVQFSWENSELVIWVKERTVSWVNTITFPAKRHPWTYESKSLRMNQVKFVEDSIAKI